MDRHRKTPRRWSRAKHHGFWSVLKESESSRSKSDAPNGWQPLRKLWTATSPCIGRFVRPSEKESLSLWMVTTAMIHIRSPQLTLLRRQGTLSFTRWKKCFPKKKWTSCARSRNDCEPPGLRQKLRTAKITWAGFRKKFAPN